MYTYHVISHGLNRLCNIFINNKCGICFDVKLFKNVSLYFPVICHLVVTIHFFRPNLLEIYKIPPVIN